MQSAKDLPKDLIWRSVVGHRLAQRRVHAARVPHNLGTHETVTYVGNDISADCGGAIVGKSMQLDVARVRAHRHGLTGISVGMSCSPRFA